MIRRYAPTALYITALAALLYAYATILGGCGGGNAQVTVAAAHAAACDTAEQTVEDNLDAGAITREAALRQIDCIRAVCDELSERLTDE